MIDTALPSIWYWQPGQMRCPPCRYIFATTCAKGVHAAQACAFAGASITPEERRTGGPTILIAAAELSKEALDPVVAAQMLREQVGRVDLPAGFEEFNRTIAGSLLDPQTLRVNVAELAKSLSAADADGRRGVSPHPRGERVSEVSQESLVAERNPGRFDDAIEL